LQYSVFKQPLVGLVGGYALYCVYIAGPWEQGLLDRLERFKQNFRADVHYQENVDWETKDSRDSMRSFIAKQVQEHGSFEAAIKNYSDKTGQSSPLFLVDDVVLDYTMKRVGVPMVGPDEPNFLHDGTPWTTECPDLTPDGKRPLPQAPKYY